MRIHAAYISLVIFFISLNSTAQTIPRTFGAQAFQMDDGTGSGKSCTIMVNGPIDESWQLRLPGSAPYSPLSYCAVDNTGNMLWMDTFPLPTLTAGNIWYGNNQNVATQLPPGISGSILTINGSSMPSWTTVLPAQITISASQITTGTIQPGVTITVGSGGSIVPGGGTIIADGLTGSGSGKYSGSVAIPQFTLLMNIPYTGITAGSNVLISISDPSGQTDQVSLQSVSPGVGFSVIFSGFYPTTSGNLNYVVVN